ncbi:hypothetical protein M378DRAFT_28036 [Amanita muscaria Koide BX008]|uniref:Uncharacterized protein n=1 Tax=Amanita muscaria (strain Koide BX008) TaxID=946122 RepID=A0A0C2WKR4_AMAMK|nr:hypothetical protein M378DRAFT_28036 [Amanita muscaria Koide BX008]
MMRGNACNVNSTTVISRSLVEAIEFLTRPLVMFYTPSEISVVQTVLQTTLTATYFASRDPRLFLVLSPAFQPPRPLLAACIAAGVRWADWIIALGGKELEVLVEPSRAVIRFSGQGGATTTIWQESKVYRPMQVHVQRPSSNEGQKSSRPTLHATFNSAIARTQRRTKAQELLEFNDKEEADEIFALLSNVTSITPTPTRLNFQLDDLSPISSPDSSRPSSRSSNFSRFSFDSSTSSTESLTSISTAASDANRKAPVKSVVCLPFGLPTSEEIPDPECSDDTSVYVDKSKISVQKYLYQGGVSTILSGGVMLGATSKAVRPTHSERPVFGKPQAPIGTRRGVAVNSDWRRL